MMHIHKKHSRSLQRGFTLVELLLYVGSIGGMLLMISLFLATILQARVKSTTIAEVEQQGMQAMALITQTVRNADTIIVPSAGASGSSLTLGVPDAGESPTVFNASGTVLQVKQGAAAPVDLTSPRVQVSNVTFRNLSRSGTPGIVQVSYTVTHVNVSGRSEYSYQRDFTGSAALR